MFAAVNAVSSLTKHDLDIHSPSRKFINLGHRTGDGLVIGVRQRIPHVAAAMSELAQVPNVLGQVEQRSNALAGFHSGVTVQQTVNPGPDQSEAELASIAAGRIVFALKGAGG